MRSFLIVLISGLIGIPVIAALALTGHLVAAIAIAIIGATWLTVDTWRLWHPVR